MTHINLISQRIFLILVALFLTACSKPENLSPSVTPVNTLMLTEVMPTPIITQPLHSMLTASPTASHNKSVIKGCVSLNNEKQNLVANGVLVFGTYDLTNFKESFYLYDFNEGTVRIFPVAKDLLHLIGISPDRKKLLYTYREGGDFPVVLADVKGKFVKQLVVKKSDGYSFDHFSWFDADMLRAIDSSNMSFLRIYSYDLKTGSYDELHTKWPDVYRGNQLDWHVDAWSLWSLSYPGANIAGANIAYDSTLNRVVYPKNDETVVLIDAKNGKELTSIKLPNWGRIPRWSNDGEKLVLVANIDENSFDIEPVEGVMPRFARNEEFFVVSRDGSEFEQLTHLTDQSSHISIDEYAWSPDGSLIAFWVNVGNNDASLDGKMSTLMLLDVNLGQVTDLCIQGISGRFNRKADGIHMIYPQPVWSPDGSQIMITQLDPKDSKKYNVLVVDLASKQAFPIVENLAPIGWMTKEP